MDTGTPDAAAGQPLAGLEPDEVVQLRLLSQMLRGPGAASPEVALRSLLAVQAQEFPYARWSLAQRVAASAGPVTAADIEQAVTDGRILRTHILRPTWHFVHRDDLRWLLALSAPPLEQANAATYRRTGIDAAVAARSAEVLASAVAGGNHLPREGLAERLHDAGFPAKGLELAYLVMHAEISGVLVSGTPVRSPGGALKQTYALFDERVPAGPEPAPERAEALAELARRYFSSRGPATVKDCADWSGLTMTDVRKGLQLAVEAHPEALAQTVIDGVVHYYSAAPYYEAGGHDAAEAGAGGAGEAGPRIDLIQCYDEYVMGYSATRHYLGGNAPTFPFQGEPMHVVLLDGRMTGSWRHTLLPGRCEVDIRLSRAETPGSPLAEAVQAAVERYGAFMGLPTVRVQPGA
ncbi:winged helix DNA-binding domain-containing protein [Pseudarthrobacter siccitolerans]|uniref:winged helix DNA-binding domain-containing protein n=1 Tax=Pseudarthrobacter siccitolerans TaxID=861266 RepID=UPI000A5AAED3|nr:winged helix DNA-binding domain-containing protein [Pseudarthrobacter siccitolerans]